MQILPFAFLLAGAVATSAPAPPPAGVGFNWLDDGSHCRVLTSRELARARCQASDNAFGLALPSRACRVSDRVEWMVYRTAAECRQALETMRANGP